MSKNLIQEHIEKIIRNVADPQKLDKLSDEKIAEISIQLVQFISNILLTAIGTALVGLIAYLLVNRIQTKNVSITKEIERQRLLHDMEKSFQALSFTHCFWPNKHPVLIEKTSYCFIEALKKEVVWLPPEVIKNEGVKYKWKNGERFILIDCKGSQISSAMLHEALFWFRRLHRAYSAKLIDDDDLYDMWRHILPFITCNRYSFLMKYFGKADIAPIYVLSAAVIKHCDKMKQKPKRDKRGKESAEDAKKEKNEEQFPPFLYLNMKVDETFLMALKEHRVSIKENLLHFGATSETFHTDQNRA